MRPFTFSLNPERDNTIQINLSPQTGEFSVVYGLYLQYLMFRSTTANFDIDNVNNRKKIARFLQFDSSEVRSLQRCSRPPGSYVPGTLRRWNGEWYCIPQAYAQKYFELCMLILDQPQLKSKADETARGVQQLLKRPLPNPP